MRITGISNCNFAKSPKKVNLTKQKVRIFNPKPERDPEKILVIATKNPALFCSGGLELRNISLDLSRGFVQSVYASDYKE